MKSFATGVNVRFFNVMTPTGQGGIGRSTGKTLSRGTLAPNRSSEAGETPKKGPLGRRALMREAAPHTAPSAGNVMPRARNASATSETEIVSGSGRHQDSWASSDRSTLRSRVHIFFGNDRYRG